MQDTTLWVHIFIQMTAWGVIFPVGMVLGVRYSCNSSPSMLLSLPAIKTFGLYISNTRANLDSLLKADGTSPYKPSAASWRCSDTFSATCTAAASSGPTSTPYSPLP